MGTQAQLQPQSAQSQPTGANWKLATRLGFRFCFIYFSLFCALTQILPSFFPLADVEFDPSTLWPTRQIVTWVAVHLFGVKTQLVYFSGSGDKTFDWVLTFCLLVLAVVATAIWSALDRPRKNYVTLYKWFRLAIRFCLAGQMFVYGVDKLVPLQMPFPFLTRLVEPFGNFSPMGVLWSFIGASPAYEIFAGCAETLAGILLVIPRTAMLGALICLADMVQVFMLNMAYDTPVKLFSFHLILMSLFLLAPDLKRLADLFLFNRVAGPSTQPPLFSTLRANRIAVVAQLVLGVSLLGVNLYAARSAWYQFGGGQPKSALYGIWDVNQFTIDGQTHPPLLTDNDRWRRAIFEFPGHMSFQRMDDSFVRYAASIDANSTQLSLTRPDDKNWKVNFVFHRPVQNQLTLDGDMDGHKLHMELQLLDAKKSLLVSRGFHWVQEYPFNR